jgi:hypothetical protein
MARYFTHLRESASIDNFLAGTSQSSKSNQAVNLPAASEMPATTITRREAQELSVPRAGSRTATDSSPSVAPASFEEALPK